jgi:putative flippase GtrA
MNWAHQFAAYFGVGAAAAVVHFGVLIALVQLTGVDPLWAALAAYTIASVASYLLNRRHTYASSRPHSEATWRFSVVTLVGFGLTWICMHTLMARVGLSYLVAQIITIGIVLIWGFIAHKLWTFAE